MVRTGLMPAALDSLPPVVIDWGQTRYLEGLDQQERLLVKRIAGDVPDTLVLTEHAPVYTVGLRSGATRHLLWDQSHLAQVGIELAETNRGGDITYHGPGQLIGYPIVSLASHRDLHAYLRFLEDVLIGTTAKFGLVATRREGKTGIWIGKRKIAAIGIAVRRWVAYHGVALNVEPNLAHFDGIIPCGIASEEGTVTSLAAELPRPPSMDEVKVTFAAQFLGRWKTFRDAGRSSSA